MESYSEATMGEELKWEAFVRSFWQVKKMPAEQQLPSLSTFPSVASKPDEEREVLLPPSPWNARSCMPPLLACCVPPKALAISYRPSHLVGWSPRALQFPFHPLAISFLPPCSGRHECRRKDWQHGFPMGDRVLICNLLAAHLRSAAPLQHHSLDVHIEGSESVRAGLLGERQVFRMQSPGTLSPVCSLPPVCMLRRPDQSTATDLRLDGCHQFADCY